MKLTDESAFVLQENGKLLVKPYIEELPELFVSYFKEILRAGYEIPRLEYYMSHGMCMRNGLLHHTEILYDLLDSLVKQKLVYFAFSFFFHPFLSVTFISGRLNSIVCSLNESIFDFSIAH